MPRFLVWLKMVTGLGAYISNKNGKENGFPTQRFIEISSIMAMIYHSLKRGKGSWWSCIQSCFNLFLKGPCREEQTNSQVWMPRLRSLLYSFWWYSDMYTLYHHGELTLCWGEICLGIYSTRGDHWRANARKLTLKYNIYCRNFIFNVEVFNRGITRLGI